MKGLLITNKYSARSDRFKILKEGFLNASKNFDLQLDYKNNEEAYDLLFEPAKFDFILFYDKDLKLAKGLEKKGYKLFNSAKAIELCDDKYLTYDMLDGKVKQPFTMFAPAIYYDDLSNDNEFILNIEKKFTYPFIVKECNGSFGLQVYKIDDREKFEIQLKKLGTTPFIIQEFIKSSFGKDLRLQVVGNEVVASMKRVNENGDFRANIANGAKGFSYTPNNTQTEIAITAARILGLDFAAVDFLFGKNDELILCEVNSNAHLGTISKVSGINVYEKIINYIFCIVNNC